MDSDDSWAKFLYNCRNEGKADNLFHSNDFGCNEFLMSVEEILRNFFDEKDVFGILENSILVTQLKEDPDFVYHFDENYWAQQVLLEFESKLKKYKLQ